jgi:hydroxypyruvate reductase
VTGSWVLSIAERAIASVDLRARCAAAISDRFTGSARGDKTLLAIGKAAPEMARGALDAGLDFERIVVATAFGTPIDQLAAVAPHAEILFGDHPIPDGASVRAAERLLAAARGARGDCLVLVSGGASSIAAAPSSTLGLVGERRLVRTLLDRGAPIDAINTVRRRLGPLRGGGLAAVASHGGKARVSTFVACDVLVEDASGAVRAGEPWTVGSGPACADPTPIDDAHRALRRWVPELASEVSRALEARPPVRTETTVVADPLDLAAAAAAAAAAAGFEVIAAPPTVAPLERVIAETLAAAHRLEEGRAWIRVAEPSVRLPARHGRGGRAGRLALACALSGLPPGVVLACIASDGVDGSSGNAGAIVEGRFDDEAASAAFAAFDDGPHLASAGLAIPSAPRGTNLLDLHLLVRARDRGAGQPGSIRTTTFG